MRYASPELAPETAEQGRKNVQELYRKFDSDDSGGNSRIAWYGQCRAQGMTHEQAVRDTFDFSSLWCRKIWPLRNIEIPEGW